jgi:hypothetical protein
MNRKLDSRLPDVTLPAIDPHLRSFIRWVTTDTQTAEPPPVEHSELYATFAAKHRINGRTVARLLQCGLETTHEALFTLLARATCADIAYQQGARAAAIQFFQSVTDVATDYLILKGPTLFHASRNPFKIRRSGDVDLLIAQPQRALVLAERPGFKVFKVPVLHEEVNLLYKGQKYDFHKHFPIWRRTGVFTPPRARSNGFRHHTQHTANISIAEIGYEEIVANSDCNFQSGGIRVFHPRPTMAAFLQVVHLYRDIIRLFIGWTYFRSRILLQELLDLRDLTAHHDFEAARFRELIERYGAQEQARVCASFLGAVLDDGVLLEVLGQAPLFSGLEQPVAFQADIWHGFSFEFAISPAELLTAPFATPSAVRHVAHCYLNRESGDVAARFSLEDGQSPFHINGDVQQFELSVDGDEDVELSLSYSAPSTQQAALNAYVSWGASCIHLNFECVDARRRVSASRGLSVTGHTHERSGTTHRVTLRFRVLASGDYRRGALPVVVATGNLRDDGYLENGVMLAFEVLPLQS